MKKSITFTYRPPLTTDDCFRTAIANMLQINPKKVPHFYKIHGENGYIKESIKWLNKHGKSMVYVPIGALLHGYGMDSNNNNIYPQGFCIAIFYGDEVGHVELLYNGKLQIGDSQLNKIYKSIEGYFIIYDLIPWGKNKKI